MRPWMVFLLVTCAMAQAQEADEIVDSRERAAIIDGALEKLKELYVFPDVAKEMERALRARQKRGEYQAVRSGVGFAEVLTKNLQEVSHDKHLRVEFSAQALPDIRPGWPPGFSPPPDENARKRLARANCAFETVQVLPGNIGYLRLNGFHDPRVCGDTAAAAMTFLGYSDALIVDLRGNRGGDPAMIAFVSSYLFDRPTHLNDFWERTGGTTQQWWTLAHVPGKRLDERVPVFVLTSAETFSGAEEFAYNLKNLKRATIIGEVTRGGAHPTSTHKLDEHFSIRIPWARAINPISKTNWEGVGVEPDVKVTREIALETAQKIALEQLAQSVADPQHSDAIAKELGRVNAQLQGRAN
jgi:hypothetical protein